METTRRFALPSFEEAQQLRQAEDIVHGNLVNNSDENVVSREGLSSVTKNPYGSAIGQWRGRISVRTHAPRER